MFNKHKMERKAIKNKTFTQKHQESQYNKSTNTLGYFREIIDDKNLAKTYF